MDLLSRQIIVFTSPKAGSGANREQVPRLEEMLSQRGLKCSVMHSPAELERLIKYAAEVGDQQPVVVCAGGDGTLGLVASKTLPETPLLTMPMGTENLVGRMVGQSAEAESILKTLATGYLHRIDAATANGQLFLIMATAGFDAEVVRRLHLRRKGHIRRLSYLLPILNTLTRYQFPAIRVCELDDDGSAVQVTTCRWAMAFNLPRYAAGLQIAPSAIGNDGKLDITAMCGSGIYKGIRYLYGAMTGRLDRQRDVCRFQTPRLRIESDQRVAFELDGDYAGHLPVTIESLPMRVTLVVPEDFTPVR
ncbi:protein BmrU [Stieleria sp. JC731]|nr:diacylglycerol kinase family protein [Stieleria sp. JC731]MCC9601780.1 protein BmrU [Stieleria sp. JC731]